MAFCAKRPDSGDIQDETRLEKLKGVVYTSIRMRNNLCRWGMAMILPCLLVVASGQDKGVKPTPEQITPKMIKMRSAADLNARALATAVQAEAIRSGKYDSVLSDYAKDLGGILPMNPCTGTRTGFTIVVLPGGNKANVAASSGTKCGKWTPKVFKLVL